MKTRFRWVVALVLLAGTAGIADANVPLAEVTAPWLRMLRSGDPSVRNVAAATLMEIVRKHPAAAGDVVRHMGIEENKGVADEYERHLVPLAKESPATVSALIRQIRQPDFAQNRARNFSVKVLSQVGPAANTPEFVEALADDFCPVPYAFIRVMRGLGKEAMPILAKGYRHKNGHVRERTNYAFRTMSRDPAFKTLLDSLQAEPPLLHKVRHGNGDERIQAVATLAEMARTTPGTAAALLKALDEVEDKTVQAEAEIRLTDLARESQEAFVALVASVRSDDDYQARNLAVKVLPKMGSKLNCKEIIDALADDSCPVPYAIRKIMLAAGQDAIPVLDAAMKHQSPVARNMANSILKKLPRPTTTAGPTLQP